MISILINNYRDTDIKLQYLEKFNSYELFRPEANIYGTVWNCFN
jgi:hypothetical protein